MLLELEKEKAKWNIEKDNLISKCQELNDKMTTLEKKNENLLRENEKLKNEKNMLRSRGYNKNNESRYISHITGRSKFDNSSNNSYKSAMFKALGEYSEEKSETSDKSSKVISKNGDKKEDAKNK